MITLRAARFDPRRPSEALALFLPRENAARDRYLSALPEPLRRAALAPSHAGDFEAKPDQIVTVYPTDRGIQRLIVCGRPRDDSPSAWRAAVAGAVHRVAQGKARTLSIALPVPAGEGDRRERAAAAAEGAILGAYRFDRFRTRRYTPRALTRVFLLAPDASALADVQEGVLRGTALAESQCLTRDLANLPSNEKTPARLAEIARTHARRWGLRVQILAPARMRTLGMGALLGVAQGSANPPRMVVLEHRPSRRGGNPLVLVGKGVTFDSGGLSIKPADGMMTMKYDMAGAAAVLGALCACARLRVPAHVVGILPIVENMPSGTAQRPGDIVRTLNGQTIEVLNTDAEGRLILCDALAYAARYRPAAIVDIATLTGAVSVALGSANAALVGNHDRLLDRLREASAASGEPVWTMPLQDAYTGLMDGTIADLKNLGGREAGVLTAAGFLSRFTEGTPWGHLDIAGIGWSAKDTPLSREGPTGFGVRLLTHLAEAWRPLR